MSFSPESPRVHRYMLWAMAAGAVLIGPEFGGFTALPADAAEQGMPPQPAAAGFVSADRPTGGRIVYGPLGRQQPEREAFRAGLKRSDAYFGKSLVLVGAFRSSEGRIPATVALFRATLHGTPVAGLCITAVDPQGGSRLMMLFDDEKRIATTLPGLIATVHDLSRPASATAPALAASPPRTVVAPDGTMSVSLPRDWTVTSMSDADFTVRGPDGAEVGSFGIVVSAPGGILRAPISMPFIADPLEAFVAVRRAMALQHGDPDPRTHVESASRMPSDPQHPGVAGAYVTGTAMRGTVLRRFAGLIAVTPPPQPGAPWLFRFQQFKSAPAEHFARDVPAMTIVAASYHRNNAVADAKIRASLARIQQNSAEIMRRSREALGAQTAIFNRSMASARAAQDGIDRSTAGFVHYLNDSAVVNSASSGTHWTFDASVADALVKANPRSLTIVPMNQYRKGVDY